MQTDRAGPLLYFDNAATTFPKPPAVTAAVQQAMREAGGNPGRGGHPPAARAGELVYSARETAAALFHAEPEHVVFTANCTHAVNLAVQGVLRHGDHIIISSMEHNAAARPAAALAAAGLIRYSIAEVTPDAAETLRNFRRLIRPETRAVLCTLVSNVSGQILPYREIAQLCRAHGLIFLADGAQACGVLPVTLDDGMQVLCMPGHKGLYGPMGTGMLITDGTVKLRPLMQGGTGSQSASLMQPETLPEALEPGTVNVPGIAGLKAGMEWVMQRGIDGIAAHEQALCAQILEGLQEIRGCTVYRSPGAAYAPVISFRLAGESPAETAARLAQRGICVRPGLHCAPLAHRTLGTMPEGTVRIAPGVMNTPAQAETLVRAVAAPR